MASLISLAELGHFGLWSLVSICCQAVNCSVVTTNQISST